jgi:hypothetical protein
MAPLSAIQGSHTLSRYGDRSITILPSVLPAALLQAPGGLHRFEPVVWTGSLPPRAMLLTRQGISLNVVAHAICSLPWGPSISVGLCMSPYSSDFIINLLRHRRLSGVKSLRISHRLDAIFPADCPHLSDCHCHRLRGEYWRIHRVSQHMARFY